MSSDKINPTEVLIKFKEFEKEIFTSLNNGETTYGIPAKVNSFNSYTNPYSIPSLRGTIIWNKLFPDDEIRTPSRVLLLKTYIPNIERVREVVKDERVISVFEEIFQDENLILGDGINTITIPLELEKIPDDLVKLIDFSKMVNDTVKPGLIILESLGIKLIDGVITTNMLDI